VALLGELGLLERHARPREIGAGILQVGIEKELVEFARQVVVPAYVAPGALGRVELLQPPQPVPKTVGHPGPEGADVERGRVFVDHFQKVEQVALKKVDLAVHVALGQGQHRVERDGALGMGGMDGDRDAGSVLVAERGRTSLMVDHGQITRPDQAFDKAAQQHVHGS
jgi:hypothetical protein